MTGETTIRRANETKLGLVTESFRKIGFDLGTAPESIRYDWARSLREPRIGLRPMRSRTGPEGEVSPISTYSVPHAGSNAGSNAGSQSTEE